MTEVEFPPDARIETWVERGTEVTPFYDPLLAKIIVTGSTRTEAILKLSDALHRARLSGIETNLGYLAQVAESREFQLGGVTTRLLDGFPYPRRTIEVIEGGTMTTVQDYPGRLGYWNVGVPPSGPMDSLSFRLGNRLLGNEEGAPGLECTASGPALRFHFATEIVITGAVFAPELNGEPVAQGGIIHVPDGSLLELAECQGAGVRAYILFRGGLDVPSYLGSASTFTLGRFGGHAGRALRTGDVLHVKPLHSYALRPNPRRFHRLSFRQS